VRYRHCTAGEAGFSLLEVLVATAITVGVGAATFQLFHQNERIFRDQSLKLEMQQSARLIASQIADDVRMTGQGIPALLGDAILPGSGTSRLNIRTGFSATESVVSSPAPLLVADGTPTSVIVESTTGFSSGRQAFLWTEKDWARVTVTSVSGASRSIRFTPTVTSRAPLLFVLPPSLSLDEAVSIYRDTATNTVRRTTATNTENLAQPAWAPANELAANVSELTFLYFDAEGRQVIPDTAANRTQVALIEARVSVGSSAPLSDGARPTYALSVRAIPRNMRLR
jgi:Tfp pilus assembly protein PilW